MEFGRPLVKALAFPLDENKLSAGRGQSLFVDNHRIKFSTNKTSGTALNTSEIEIYNLSPESFGFIRAFAGEEVYVRLDAGYEGDIKNLVRGTVSAIKNVFEGQDRITKVTIKEGYTNAKEAKTSTAFPTETSHSHIFTILKRDLGLPNGVVILPKTSIKAPWSFQGKTVDAFKKLALDTNSSFSLQNSTIHFMPLDTGKLTEVSKFTPQTGLIGSPTKLDNSSGVAQDNKAAPTVGIKFKVLLDGAIIPNTLVRIESREFDGVFKVQKVSHSGDFRGNEWFTLCEATQLSPFLDIE